MNLKTRWFLFFALWAVVLTVLISAVLSQVASNRLREQVGTNLAEVAFQMADKLERGMFERYRDIQVAGSLTSRLQLDRDPVEMNRLLENLQSTYSDYAWIGLTNKFGIVEASTGNVLLGMDVSSRPWYAKAMEKAYVGDVHQALLLDEKLGNEGEPLRFVDIAVPIRNADGQFQGVLGAHLDWRWTREVEASVLDSLVEHGDTELILINSNNQVVLGPDHLLEETLSWEFLSRITESSFGFSREELEDGEEYLVGYASTQGYRSYSGLEWKIIVRQPMRQAFERVTTFRYQVITVGIAVVILFALFGWYAAERISRPLLEITRAARDLGSDPNVNRIPMLRDYPEVRDLSATLNILLQRIDDKQRQLSSLNKELDSKVQERTAEVVNANEQLKTEIEERKTVQREREKLIKELERLAHTDSLTKVANRRQLFEQGEKILKRAARQGQPASLMMFDLDHFKQLNDDYGHAAGDDVLKAVGELLNDAVRETDIAARTGGEEFAVLLDATDVKGAKQLAERLRRKLSELTFDKVDSGRAVTMSLGIALWDGEEPLEQLLNRADKAMYSAKEKGRNRTETAL